MVSCTENCSFTEAVQKPRWVASAFNKKSQRSILKVHMQDVSQHHTHSLHKIHQWTGTENMPYPVQYQASISCILNTSPNVILSIASLICHSKSLRFNRHLLSQLYTYIFISPEWMVHFTRKHLTLNWFLDLRMYLIIILHYNWQNITDLIKMYTDM